MKTTSFLLTLVFSIPTFLISQPDFRPGYILSLSGDTIKGQIDYREEVFLGKLCKYRQYEEEAVVEYKPGEIQGFRFNDSKNYVSKVVDGKPVFLEYLINGRMNIYYLRDAVNKRYFFDKDDVALTEIPFEEGIRQEEGKKYMFTSTRHIGLLQHYMKDAPSAQSKASTIKRPEHKNLINMAKEYHYNVCDEGEECIIYERKPFPFRISIEPIVGVAKFRGQDQWSDVWVKEYGGNIYLWIPGSSENFTIKTGLIRQFHPGTPPDLWRIPVQLQYIYSANRIQPKVAIGFNAYGGRSGGWFHTYVLNGGVNVRLTESMALSTNINSDFVSNLQNPVEGRNLKIFSYSFNFGVYIKL